MQKQEEEQNNGEGLEVAQSGNQNDNLPEAKDASVENYYKIKASDLALGTDFLSGPYGKLFVLYVKSMVDFFAYYARVIDGVGQTSHQGGHNLTKEEPSKDEMSNIFREWRIELLTFRSCPDNPLDMATCMGETRCLIESEFGKSINASFFAVFMETQEEVNTVVLKDFELYFEETPSKVMPTCAGEPHGDDGHATEIAAFIEGFEATSERQWRAISAVATIQLAAGLTQQGSAKSSSMNPADFQDIWRPPCATLGCDQSSFIDIVQTMHGHAVELVEVDAPAPVIRAYVRAMRTSIRSVKVGFGQSSLVNFQVVLEAPGQHAAADQLYDQQIKRVAGVLDASYALLMRRGRGGKGFWQRVGKAAKKKVKTDLKKVGKAAIKTVKTVAKEANKAVKVVAEAAKVVVDIIVNLFGCLGVGAKAVIGYAYKQMSPVPPIGAIISIAPWFGLGTADILNLITGNEVCTSASAKISFGVVAGAILAAPADTAMFRAGVTISAHVSWSSCSGALNLGISAGVAGAVVWKSTLCRVGIPPTLVPKIGPFACVKGLASGGTVMCCNFNLLNGDSDCKR